MGEASIPASSPFFFFNLNDILGEDNCGGGDSKYESSTHFLFFEVQRVFTILCDRSEQRREMGYLGLSKLGIWVCEGWVLGFVEERNGGVELDGFFSNLLYI
ncbi:hypothetical protein TorRG33x02_008820 [Trema orientale]|uniref:Uncharacterized protein n=1 Tax=Trema orientale TaxID=63057 RepID=A0A2P5G0X9_TREOI|nr:hypothetical protein TorRG33x02_008820 [Trema orientale]